MSLTLLKQSRTIAAQAAHIERLESESVVLWQALEGVQECRNSQDWGCVNSWLETVVPFDTDDRQTRVIGYREQAAHIERLEEFRRAWQAVECGINDFDLHGEAVERLRAADAALYDLPGREWE